MSKNKCEFYNPTTKSVLFDVVGEDKKNLCAVRKDVTGRTPEIAFDIAFKRLRLEGYEKNIHLTTDYGNYLYYGFGRTSEDEKSENNFWLRVTDPESANCYVFSGEKR